MAYCHNNERIHVEGGYIGHDVSRWEVIARLYAIVCRSLTIIGSVERCRRRATKQHFSNTCTTDDGVCG